MKKYEIDYTNFDPEKEYDVNNKNVNRSHNRLVYENTRSAFKDPEVQKELSKRAKEKHPDMCKKGGENGKWVLEMYREENHAKLTEYMNNRTEEEIKRHNKKVSDIMMSKGTHPSQQEHICSKCGQYVKGDGGYGRHLQKHERMDKMLSDVYDKLPHGYNYAKAYSKVMVECGYKSHNFGALVDWFPEKFEVIKEGAWFKYKKVAK